MSNIENPKIKTKVVHSKSKTAYNIIAVTIPAKFKIARIPYLVVENNEELSKKFKDEALCHANFIRYCFNNSNEILSSANIKELSVNIDDEILKLVEEISTWELLADTLTQEHQMKVKRAILDKVENLKIKLSEVKSMKYEQNKDN